MCSVSVGAASIAHLALCNTPPCHAPAGLTQRSRPMAQILILKPGHFHSIDDDIIDVHGRTIGAIGYAVYGYLRRRMNQKTGQCNPSIARIAKAFDMARSTVKEYLH